MTTNKVQGTGFAQIANAALRDKRLSFRARGILSMVLSYSGDWDSPRDWLETMSEREGRDAIQSALNELTELGYREVVKTQLADGTWRTVVHWLHTPGTDVTEGRVSRPSVEPTVGSAVLPPEHHHQNTKSGSAAPPPADPRLTQFSLLDPPVPTVGKSKRRGTETPIPPEWLDLDTPPAPLIAKAKEVGLATDLIGPSWRAFVAWHAAKDTRYVRWEWAWRTWVTKEVTRNKTKTKTTIDPKTGIAYGPPGRPDDAWMYRQDYDVNPLEGIR